MTPLEEARQRIALLESELIVEKKRRKDILQSIWHTCGICKDKREHHVLEDIYRCYFCHVWVCEDCAREHFIERAL